MTITNLNAILNISSGGMITATNFVISRSYATSEDPTKNIQKLDTLHGNDEDTIENGNKHVILIAVLGTIGLLLITSAGFLVYLKYQTHKNKTPVPLIPGLYNILSSEYCTVCSSVVTD
jgi:hypothetical protein